MPHQVCLTRSQARMEGSENALAGVAFSHKADLHLLRLNDLCEDRPPQRIFKNPH